MATQDIHRTPPHSTEAEQGVLGSMMISPKETIGHCVEQITEEYFYVPAHQLIYSTMVEIWNSGGSLDLITFTQTLRDKGMLEQVGGASFITDLRLFVPTAANVLYYLEIVKDKYLLRQMISAGTEAVRKAYEEQGEVSALLDSFEQSVFSIATGSNVSKLRTGKDLVQKALDGIEHLYNNKGAVTGVATGFKDFDRLTSGLQRSEMIVIAGRPSMGKTALAMNIVEHAATVLNLPVGVFSLEMSGEQLAQRMMCSMARVNIQKVRDGFMTERDFPALVNASSKIANAKLFVDESCDLDIHSIRARARRMKSEHGIQLLVVDYLQIIKDQNRGKGVNREREVSLMSFGMKQMAKELKIPVVVLVQLNRQPEGRSGGRPKLSDLRESGSIEQDADVVALLVRPEVYEEDEDDRMQKSGQAELIIAKQRNGPTGDIALTFVKDYTRFENSAPRIENNG